MEVLVGRVKHYYPHIPVMVVELEESLKIGDKIVVKKKNGEERFSQVVESMEIERKKVNEVKAGQEVSILCAGKTKEGDLVYKFTE
jgi:translation initiation factor IF-2